MPHGSARMGIPGVITGGLAIVVWKTARVMVRQPQVRQPQARQPDKQEYFVLSYLGLRKAVGYIGTALPLVLAVGRIALHGSGIENTLSAYYYTAMRDVFVGSLWAIAVFLLSYRGHDRRDDLAGNLACLFGLGVALLPTAPPRNATALEQWISVGHFASAALFLSTLAYFSLVLFRKSAPGKEMTSRKHQRNIVYAVCGYAMLVCLAAIALLHVLPGNLPAHPSRPVFWLESLAIVAFGVSWLTKGQAILKDLHQD